MRSLLHVAVPAFSLVLLATACDEPAPPPVEIAPEEPAPPPVARPGVGTPIAPASPPTGTEVTSADGKIMKSFALPGGTIEVPPSWNPKLRQDPPMRALHVMPMPGMTCDIAFLKGHGTRKEAEEYLTAGANAYAGAEEKTPDIIVGGNLFQGIQIKKPKSFKDNPDALVEVFASVSGNDLLGIGVTRLAPSDQQTMARASCLEAFARYTSNLPNEATDLDAHRPAPDKPSH